jgi:hypothetical protein
MKTLPSHKLLLSISIALLSLLAFTISAANSAYAGATVSPVKTVSQSSSQAQSVLRKAKAELRKGAQEKNGNNVVRYRNGKVAPYNINMPWSAAFVSYLMTSSGVPGLNKYATLKSSSGVKVVAYIGSLEAWAKRNGRLSQTARPGYLALYGNSHVAIVSTINSNRQARTVIAGNVNDRVRHTAAGKPTAYIRL